MSASNPPLNRGTTTTTTTHPLSLWDQVAPRNYMSIVLCFSSAQTHPSAQLSVSNHLRTALSRLASRRREFAGTLHLGGPGSTNPHHVLLSTSPAHHIPLHVVDLYDESDTRYEGLREEGFPARVFVDRRLVVSGELRPGGKRVPVVQIRFVFVRGGFFLLVYLHHAFGDGSCMDALLKELGDETRLGADLVVEDEQEETEEVDRTFDIDLPTGEGGGNGFDQLLKQCPEYGLLPEPTGPTQPILPPIEGIECHDLEEKIFIIDKNRLDAVRQQLSNSTPCQGPQPTVSRYMTLAALTWAHTTRARLSTSCLSPSLLAHHQPTLFNSHDWLSPTKNLFPTNHSLRHYFGNSISWAVTRFPSTASLISSCLPSSPPSSSSSLNPLANLATGISNFNTTISAPHIQTRTRLFSAIPDIRRLGLALDARLPHYFSFNTWLHLGSRATFLFPSYGEGDDRQKKPDAIRRVQGNCGLPSALILPDVGTGEGEIWLLITLEREAMGVLEGDGGWMGICREVIGSASVLGETVGGDDDAAIFI
ncbi:hypothetical protein GE09DRAFT_1269971 [Coniochaeta sp. 2T2.1]|nr:hypothetical protein GE09DRAFT_1269971 [Coniochaeta sp. 2T2.1]